MSLSITPEHKPLVWPFVLLGISLLLAGGYFFYLLATPQLHLNTYIQDSSAAATTLKTEDVAEDNRLYIPKIGVNISYGTGDASVLNSAAWHRYPERGDPFKGGNFILAGHRLELAPTPEETHRKSPFYGLDKLSEGDAIYADFNGKRYEYKVAKRFTVAPQQTEIEAESSTPKMTLYTCTLNGASEGREVIEAVPVKD